LHLLPLIAVAIVLVGAVIIFKRTRTLAALLAFSIIGLGLSTAIIASAYACPKYMPVPVMFVAFLLGTSVAAMHQVRGGRTLAVAFIVLMLFSSPAKIFAQWLGMVQSLYEMADIIQFLDTKSAEGYSLTWTGIQSDKEWPQEKASTFREFFEYDAVRLYGYDKGREFSSLSEKGVPASGRFVLVTSITPHAVASGALASVGVTDLSDAVGIYVFERERYGFFEQVTSILKRIDQHLGVNLQDPIDCQPPYASRFGAGFPNAAHSLLYFPLHAGPHLIYVFDRGRASPVAVKEEPTALPPLRRYGAFLR
jgi:hypothetical protein